MGCTREKRKNIVSYGSLFFELWGWDVTIIRSYQKS